MPKRQINNIRKDLSLNEFRAFLASVNDFPGDIISFSIDRDYKYVSYNDNYKKYLKTHFDIEISPGFSMLEVFKGYGDLRKEQLNFERAFAGTEFSQIGQYKIKTKTYFYKDIYKPVFNETGEIIGVTVFYTNITQRKQSERAWEIMLNISERVNLSGSFEDFLGFIRRELGKIINTTNFYVALYNEENNRYAFPYYADRYDKLEKYKYYDLSQSITDYVRRTGQPLLLTYQKEQELLKTNQIKLFGTASPSWMGIPLKTKDRTIGVLVIQDYDREEAYNSKDLELMASVSDHIANAVEKKQTEKRLEEATQKLLYAQKIAKLGHLEIDLYTGRLTVSDSAQELLGVNPNDYKYLEDLKQIVEPKDWHLIEGIFEKLKHTKEGFYDTDFRIKHPKTGENLYFNTKSEYIFGQSGKPVKISTLIQDITEQQKDKLELKLAKEKAEESDKLKSAFLANMSHEIRTPMNAILGFSKLLADPAADTDTRGKYAGYITSSANNLLKLINDILDVAKIEAGQLAIRKKVVNIHSEMDELLEEFKQQRREMKKDQIDLRLSLGSDSEDLLIITDQLRFRQIFTNLLGNAMKFTNEGYIEFGYTIKDERTLEFYVKDTGAGIPEDKKRLIFSRFGQVINDEVKHPGGTGLGLSITKHLVERLGGKISLKTEKNEGSLFYFTLPFDKGDKSKLKPKSKAVKVDFKDLQELEILVVEDNKVNQILVQDIIERWAPNNKLSFADDGKQAMEAFHKMRYDIIFMDIKLPDNDGFELTSYVRNIHTPNIHTPIIGLSAHAMKEYKDKAKKVGMNGFLTKPFVPDAFFKILTKHTNTKVKRIKTSQKSLDNFRYIDLSILKPIYESKPERMTQIVSLYAENISSGIEKLEQKIKTGTDAEEIRQITHALKSSLRYLGLNDAGDLAYLIEKEPDAPCEDYVKQIKLIWKQAKSELDSIL